MVTAYVDAACNPNPGRGGWGVLLRCGSREKRLSGPAPEESTTNQRAELFAAVQALLAPKQPCRVRIVSDAQYLVRTMQGSYCRRSNHDLWEALDMAAAPQAVEWVWVHRHAGDEGNARAHELAEGALEDLVLVEVEITPPEGPPICEPRRQAGRRVVGGGGTG
jgi:ribonuclease HI